MAELHFPLLPMGPGRQSNPPSLTLSFFLSTLPPKVGEEVKSSAASTELSFCKPTDLQDPGPVTRSI